MRLYTFLLGAAILVTVVTSQPHPCFYNHPDTLESVEGVCIPQCAGEDERDNSGIPGRRGLICMGEKGEQRETSQDIDLHEIKDMVTAANENITGLVVRTEQLEAENANLKENMDVLVVRTEHLETENDILKGKYNQLKQENADLITRVNSNAADLEAITGTVDNIPVLVRHCAAGLKDGTIPDSDMSASSSYRWKWSHGPEAARLDAQIKPYVHIGAWVAGGSLKQQTSAWIQVDFRSPTDLTGVITQGRPRGRAGHYNWEDASQWVTSFEIRHSNDEQTWTTINKRFQGNDDWNSHVVNMFPETVQARYVRLYPLSCHRYCSLRMEYLKC